MIPVQPQPEPTNFDKKVRQPGQEWLRKKGFSSDQPLPVKTKPKAFLRECLDELHQEYGGVCAYLAIYIERATGSASADHFVAKSTSEAYLVYEWSNYRLACLAMNARKRAFDEVLDPFDLPENVFQLNLTTGRIYVNPVLEMKDRKLFDDANVTIYRLKLDDGINRGKRTKHFGDYVQKSISESHLRENSPFVWHEAQRQGLL